MAELKIICMDEVAVEEVKWLWYPYIPFGKLTIIHGDGGEGKTTLKHRLDLHLTDSGGREKNLLTAALFMLQNRTVFSLNHREVACFSVDV